MTRWCVIACCALLVACSSPTDPGHVNVIAGTLNDTAWTASQIVYLALTPVANSATADSIEFSAFGSGDTLELHAYVDNNSVYTIAQPTDYLRVRTSRGVFQIHLGADAFADTVNCTRLYYGVVEGTIVTGVPLVNVNNDKDSMRLNCHFSLQFVY